VALASEGAFNGTVIVMISAALKRHVVSADVCRYVSVWIPHAYKGWAAAKSRFKDSQVASRRSENVGSNHSSKSCIQGAWPVVAGFQSNLVLIFQLKVGTLYPSIHPSDFSML
jgi:hypothetical protein